MKKKSLIILLLCLALVLGGCGSGGTQNQGQENENQQNQQTETTGSSIDEPIPDIKPTIISEKDVIGIWECECLLNLYTNEGFCDVVEAQVYFQLDEDGSGMSYLISNEVKSEANIYSWSVNGSSLNLAFWEGVDRDIDISLKGGDMLMWLNWQTYAFEPFDGAITDVSERIETTSFDYVLSIIDGYNSDVNDPLGKHRRAEELIAQQTGAPMEHGQCQFICDYAVDENFYDIYSFNGSFYGVRDYYSFCEIAFEGSQNDYGNAEEFVICNHHHLISYDESLIIGPYGSYRGPGSNAVIPGLSDSETITVNDTVLDAAVEADGDSWHLTDFGGKLKIKYYSDVSEDELRITEIDTDWADESQVKTPRGLKIGDTKKRAQELYPEASDQQNPALEADGDYIWISSGENGTGASLTIFFEKNKVSRFLVTYYDGE